MTVPRTVVVVGSSIGGVRTAQALRSEGFDGRIVLVGEEPRPALRQAPAVQAVPRRQLGADRVALLTDEAAEAAGIELRLGVRAERLDIAGREVVLADGDAVPFDVVVLATGAAARPSPWRPSPACTSSGR